MQIISSSSLALSLMVIINLNGMESSKRAEDLKREALSQAARKQKINRKQKDVSRAAARKDKQRRHEQIDSNAMHADEYDN